MQMIHKKYQTLFVFLKEAFFIKNVLSAEITI